jgi:hypothetical protein
VHPKDRTQPKLRAMLGDITTFDAEPSSMPPTISLMGLHAP